MCAWIEAQGDQLPNPETLASVIRTAEQRWQQIKNFRLGVGSVQPVRPPVQGTLPVQDTKPVQPVQNTEPVAPAPAQRVAPTEEKFVKVGLSRMLNGMPPEDVNKLNNTQLAKLWTDQGGRGVPRYVRDLVTQYKNASREP